MSEFEFSAPADRDKRESTLTDVIEAIDETAPETKAELGDELDLSSNYLSGLIRDLKSHGLVKKAYVVDEAAVLEAAPSLSALAPGHGDRTAAADQPARDETSVRRLFDRLDALDATTSDQYAAARATFEGEAVEESAADLEPLANERSRVVFEELKSMTLSVEWPSNRVAADLSTIAMNLEIVGDRACFLEEGVESLDISTTSVVHDRLATIFEGGSEVHRLLRRILFDVELDCLDTLYGVEDEIHHNLNELFELVTIYDPEQYGHLASLTRTLEQTIYYWVHAAELAVRLHSGIIPEHISEV